MKPPIFELWMRHRSVLRVLLGCTDSIASATSSWESLKMFLKCYINKCRFSYSICSTNKDNFNFIFIKIFISYFAHCCDHTWQVSDSHRPPWKQRQDAVAEFEAVGTPSGSIHTWWQTEAMTDVTTVACPKWSQAPNPQLSTTPGAAAAAEGPSLLPWAHQLWLLSIVSL